MAVLIATMLLLTACQQSEIAEYNSDNVFAPDYENAQCGGCLILDETSAMMSEEDRVEYYASMEPDELLDLLNNQESNVEERCSWYYDGKFCSEPSCVDSYGSQYPDRVWYYNCQYHTYSFCSYRNSCH